MRILLIGFLAIGLVIPHAHTRPVSYPGGWTLMSMNDAQRRSAHIHYSPTVRTSIGYKFEDWHNRDFSVNALQINKLVKRWNEKHSQANLYWKSGIGVANSEISNSNELAAFTGFAADWEDRRYFFAYKNRYTEANTIDDFFRQSVRAGWAPYEGDYGDLHTWLMLEIQHMPEADHSVTATPLVRLFKDVHMVELGINNRGNILINYIFRY